MLVAAMLLTATNQSVAQNRQPQKSGVDVSAKKKQKQAQKEELPPLVAEEEAIDLGLSKKYRETKPKALYKPDTYRWFQKSTGVMDIGKQISGTKLDAARVIWRGAWRLPTREECTELRDKCKWTLTTRNGVKGMLVTGPNGNSIFLPSGGYRQGDYTTILADQVRGEYWTGNLVRYDSGNYDKDHGFKMDFVDNPGGLHSGYRFQGCLIRAVTDAPVLPSSVAPAPKPTPVPTPKPAPGSTSVPSAAQAIARGELGIFDLRGPVKSCTWINEWGNTTRTFDAQGFWKTMDGKSLNAIFPSGIKRDAKGRIVKGLVDSEGNGEDYTYDAQGRVVKYFFHVYDDINSETTRYGADGYILQRRFEPGGMDAGEPYTETYRNVVVDKHGNWTERKVYSTDASITVQKRTITYY